MLADGERPTAFGVVPLKAEEVVTVLQLACVGVKAPAADGATGRQQLFGITLPLLRPVMITSTVLGLIWTSNYFEAIFVMTGGGPARSTETLPMFIYNTGFTFYRIEEAMAGSNLLMLIVLLMLGLYALVVRTINRNAPRPEEA